MHHLAAFTLLFAAPAFAQLSAPTPTPPLPPTPLRSQPRIMQLRMPRAEPGSDLNIIPSGTWWRYPETIKDISLSPDQQHKMDDIFRQNRIQLIDLKASLEKEQLNLEPILNGNPPDTGKAYAEIAHIADLRADLEKANAKMLLGLRALLTADQWTKLQAHRPGVSISTDEGQNWQSLSSMKDLSTSTTCNAMFNNSGKDCTITTVSTKRENGPHRRHHLHLHRRPVHPQVHHLAQRLQPILFPDPPVERHHPTPRLLQDGNPRRPARHLNLDPLP